MELQGWGEEIQEWGSHGTSSGLMYHGSRMGEEEHMTAVLFQRPVGCELWPREFRMPELDLRGRRARGLCPW